MAFMDMIDDLAEKCGLNRGDRMQYALVGLIILVIIFSAITLVMSFTGGGPGSGKMGKPQPMKYFCLETNKEFTIDPAKFDTPEEQMDIEIAYTIDPFQGRVPSPFTGKNTAVPMVKCPACGEWYVPDAYVQMNPEMPVVCKNPDCQTDLNEWYREQRRKRRK